ncbi:hypothetical protein JRQ81_016070, partial [Phrynocephalus forsythii]
MGLPPTALERDAFLTPQYPPRMIKEQINKARHIPRDNLLPDRSKGPNDRTLLVVTYSLQVRPLTCILIDFQPILDKKTSLSKALQRERTMSCSVP